MTHKELFEALVQGKKVRRSHWPASEWIMLRSGMLIDERGEPSYLDIACNEVYELYQEPEVSTATELISRWSSLASESFYRGDYSGAIDALLRIVDIKYKAATEAK